MTGRQADAITLRGLQILVQGCCNGSNAVPTTVVVPVVPDPQHLKLTALANPPYHSAGVTRRTSPATLFNEFPAQPGLHRIEEQAERVRSLNRGTSHQEHLLQ